MKKLLGILMIAVLLSMSSCISDNKYENKDTHFYFGQSNSWLAVYTITKVKSSYYDSLSIQYIFDDNNNNQTEKIGPIEYELTGNSMKIGSSSPQELQGTANFHTGSRMNVNNVKVTFDKEIILTVKWQDKSETLKLERQN